MQSAPECCMPSSTTLRCVALSMALAPSHLIALPSVFALLPADSQSHLARVVRLASVASTFVFMPASGRTFRRAYFSAPSMTLPQHPLPSSPFQPVFAFSCACIICIMVHKWSIRQPFHVAISHTQMYPVLPCIVVTSTCNTSPGIAFS